MVLDDVNFQIMMLGELFLANRAYNFLIFVNMAYSLPLSDAVDLLVMLIEVVLS